MHYILALFMHTAFGVASETNLAGSSPTIFWIARGPVTETKHTHTHSVKDSYIHVYTSAHASCVALQQD